MNKHYITFGQVHAHQVGEKYFHKNLVGVIYAGDYTQARMLAFQIFGNKWCFLYEEADWDEADMRHFPDGYLAVNKEQN